MTAPSSDLARRFFALPSGQRVRECLQCGACAVACPLRRRMDLPPRRLWALLTAGRWPEAVRANTMWLCTSCYACKVRCPRGVPILAAMYDLKHLCLQAGRGQEPQAGLHRAFWQEFSRRGRVGEGWLMARFLLAQGLGAAIRRALAMRGVGLSLLKKGRLPWRPPRRARGLKSLQRIIACSRQQEEKNLEV